jgi:hypothetical protein
MNGPVGFVSSGLGMGPDLSGDVPAGIGMGGGVGGGGYRTAQQPMLNRPIAMSVPGGPMYDNNPNAYVGGRGQPTGYRTRPNGPLPNEYAGRGGYGMEHAPQTRSSPVMMVPQHTQRQQQQQQQGGYDANMYELTPSTGMGHMRMGGGVNGVYSNAVPPQHQQQQQPQQPPQMYAGMPRPPMSQRGSREGYGQQQQRWSAENGRSRSVPLQHHQMPPQMQSQMQPQQMQQSSYGSSASVVYNKQAIEERPSSPPRYGDDAIELSAGARPFVPKFAPMPQLQSQMPAAGLGSQNWNTSLGGPSSQMGSILNGSRVADSGMSAGLGRQSTLGPGRSLGLGATGVPVGAGTWDSLLPPAAPGSSLLGSSLQTAPMDLQQSSAAMSSGTSRLAALGGQSLGGGGSTGGSLGALSSLTGPSDGFSDSLLSGLLGPKMSLHIDTHVDGNGNSIPTPLGSLNRYISDVVDSPANSIAPGSLPPQMNR